jgi:hypothetical protein
LKKYDGMTKLVLSCNILFTYLYLLKFYDILYGGTFQMQRRDSWKKCVFLHIFKIFFYLFYLNIEGNLLFLVKTKPHHSFRLQNSIPKGLGFICGLKKLFFSTWSTSILKYKCNPNVHFTMLLPSLQNPWKFDGVLSFWSLQ